MRQSIKVLTVTTATSALIGLMSPAPAAVASSKSPERPMVHTHEVDAAPQLSAAGLFARPSSPKTGLSQTGTGVLPLPATTGDALAAATVAAGSYVWNNVIANTVYVWNYYTSSTTVSTNTVVPAGARFSHVGWTASATTYNTQYPGALKLRMCAIAPVIRCYDVSNSPDAATTLFNDLDPATAKFVLDYAWYNASKTSGSALVGAGIKPYIRASIDVGWQ